MELTHNKPEDAVGAKVSTLDLAELYRCVHCGLCLNQCPTYRVTRLETESPRGRIHLVKAAADGRIELNELFKEHMQLCLLCRACESACPSGVQYGRIAETAREHIGPPGSPIAKVILNFVFTQLLPHSGRLKLAFALLRLYQRTGLQKLLRVCMPEQLRRMDALLPTIPSEFFRPASSVLAAIGPRRARVAMLNGCVMPLMFGDVNAATVRVLRRSGCEVIFPERQLCCGAFNIHNGESVAAKAMARSTIDAFLATSVDAIVVNAAGCGAAMKEYDFLLRDDKRYADKAKRFTALVKDAGEFLAGLGMVGELQPINLTVTYQDPCHLVHGQKIHRQPRDLLRAIPGLKLVEMEGSDRCCGSAGIYNLTHAGMSQQLLNEKMHLVNATNADAIVAPNPGCMLQLRYGAQHYGPNLPVYHLMDLLDRAYGEAAVNS